MIRDAGIVRAPPVTQARMPGPTMKTTDRLTQPGTILGDLNDRSREVFRRVVEGYLETGAPVGSRTLTRSLSEQVSAATVRNVMQDLEYLGLLGSPHISAGRIPTQMGLRMFLDGFLEVGELTASDKQNLDDMLGSNTADVTATLDRIGAALSQATHGASIVLAPKREAPIKHIDFVALSPDRALVVLVHSDGQVENRLFQPPPGHTPSAMREAANYLNAHLADRTLGSLRAEMQREVDSRRAQIDELAGHLIAAGLAVWDSEDTDIGRLIVRGRSNLLSDSAPAEDFERIRQLFDDLERKRDIADFLELAETGEGVRIFIGSENKLFSLSGSALVVSPYMNADRKIVGAVGVIGPTRLNYGRIVPIVDYTAQLLGKLMADRG
jgi:heat-inducible transcriptional repressor